MEVSEAAPRRSLRVVYVLRKVLSIPEVEVIIPIVKSRHGG